MLASSLACLFVLPRRGRRLRVPVRPLATTCICIRGELTADVRLQAAAGEDGDAQLRNESKLRHRRLELRWYGMRLFSRASAEPCAEPVDLSSEVKVALNAAVASRVGTEAATPATKQRALQSCGLRTSSEEAWYSLG